MPHICLYVVQLIYNNHILTLSNFRIYHTRGAKFTTNSFTTLHRKLGMSQSLAENPFQESPVFQCDADAPSSPFPPERDTPFQELTYHPPSLTLSSTITHQSRPPFSVSPDRQKAYSRILIVFILFQQPGTPSTQNPTLSLQ